MDINKKVIKLTDWITLAVVLLISVFAISPKSADVYEARDGSELISSIDIRIDLDDAWESRHTGRANADVRYMNGGKTPVYLYINDSGLVSLVLGSYTDSDQVTHPEQHRTVPSGTYSSYTFRGYKNGDKDGYFIVNTGFFDKRSKPGGAYTNPDIHEEYLKRQEEKKRKEEEERKKQESAQKPTPAPTPAPKPAPKPSPAPKPAPTQSQDTGKTDNQANPSVNNKVVSNNTKTNSKTTTTSRPTSNGRTTKISPSVVNNEIVEKHYEDILNGTLDVESITEEELEELDEVGYVDADSGEFVVYEEVIVEDFIGEQLSVSDYYDTDVSQLDITTRGSEVFPLLEDEDSYGTETVTLASASQEKLTSESNKNSFVVWLSNLVNSLTSSVKALF